MKTGTTTPIYNGNSIRQILSKKPYGMTKSDRNWYIKNCIEVYENEKEKVNLGYCNAVRNTNFNITKRYLIANN